MRSDAWAVPASAVRREAMSIMMIRAMMRNGAYCADQLQRKVPAHRQHQARVIDAGRGEDGREARQCRRRA